MISAFVARPAVSRATGGHCVSFKSPVPQSGQGPLHEARNDGCSAPGRIPGCPPDRRGHTPDGRESEDIHGGDGATTLTDRREVPE